MPVGADALEREPEADALELPVVLVGGRLTAELAADAMDLGGLLLDSVEQLLLGEQVVRALVVWRDAALVAPPELRFAPVRLELRRKLERVPGGAAAGEREVLAGPRRGDEELRACPLRLGSGLEDADVREGAACGAVFRPRGFPSRPSEMTGRCV